MSQFLKILLFVSITMIGAAVNHVVADELDTYTPDPAPCLDCEGQVSNLSYTTLNILQKLDMESDVALKHKIMEFERNHFLVFNPLTGKSSLKCGSFTEDFKKENTFGDIFIPLPFEKLKDRNITEIILESEGIHLFITSVFIDGHKALAVFKTKNGRLQDFAYYLRSENGYELFKTPEEENPLVITASQTLSKDNKGNIERLQLTQSFSFDPKHPLAGLSGGQTIVGTQINTFEINSFVKFRDDEGEVIHYGVRADQKHKPRSDELKMTADMKILIADYISLYGEESLRGMSSNPTLYGERTYGVNMEGDEISMNIEGRQTYERSVDGVLVLAHSKSAALGFSSMNFTASQERNYDEEGDLESVENSQNAEIQLGESIILNGTNTRNRDLSMESTSNSRTMGVLYEQGHVSSSIELGDSKEETGEDRTVNRSQSASISIDDYSLSYSGSREIAPDSNSRFDSVVVKFKDPFERAWDLSLGRGYDSEEGKSWEGKIKLVDGLHTYSLEHFESVPEKRSKLTYTYQVEDYDAEELGVFDGNVTVWVETKKKLQTSDSGGGIRFELFAN